MKGGVIKMKKKKQVTYRVWKEEGGSARGGDDTFRSIKGTKAAAKRALMLHRKGKLNSIMIETGRNITSERLPTKSEARKLNIALKSLVSKKKKARRTRRRSMYQPSQNW